MLFGKNDQDLPLLTQFLQLTPTHIEAIQGVFLDDNQRQRLVGSEIGRWYARERYGNDVPLATATNWLLAALWDHNRVFDLVKLHPIIRTVLENVADKGGTTAGLLSELEPYFVENLQPRLYLHRKRPDTDTVRFSPFAGETERLDHEYVNLLVADLGQNFFLPLDQLSAFPAGTHDCVGEVLQQTRDVLFQKEQVARCVECKNPFLIRKTGQSYCSYRCADRAGSRRRRESAKSAKITTL